jgi:signal transduction histidine kinase
MKRSAHSLRLRLAAGVGGALGLSLCAFSLVLYATFSRALWRQFDERLAQDARAVANMVEERARGPWEIEPAVLEDFENQYGAVYFEIWMDDGTVLVRSPSLGARDLERPRLHEATQVVAARLADGRNGRLLRTFLPPRADEEGPAHPSGRRVAVAVARATDEVDATLATLRLLLWVAGAGALLLAVLAAAFAVRGSLAPIARLAARIDAMDARCLGERLPVADLPRELRPAVLRLNELLGRLQESVRRERQFSADVSHELRTPLAGLRSLLEVAASRERPAADYQAAIAEGLRVVLQMHVLVENLLMLARLEAHQVPVAAEPIDLHELVEECFGPLASKAGERQLTFENLVPEGAAITSDREKLRLVVTNLLANAVDYTAAQGRVTVEGALPPAGILAVCDSGPAIPEVALEKIFDRFFRLDPSRAGTGERGGIGLALTRALCQTLGLAVVAENRPDGWVAFRIRRAATSTLRAQRESQPQPSA